MPRRPEPQTYEETIRFVRDGGLSAVPLDSATAHHMRMAQASPRAAMAPVSVLQVGRREGRREGDASPILETRRVDEGKPPSIVDLLGSRPNTAAMSPDVVNGRDPLAPKPKFFGKGGDGWGLLGIIGDALLQHAGRQPVYGPAMEKRREREDESNDRLRMWRLKVAAEQQDHMRPKVEQVGNLLGNYDPASNSFSPIDSAPQPFEAYARALGYEPGTPEYQGGGEETTCSACGATTRWKASSRSRRRG